MWTCVGFLIIFLIINWLYRKPLVSGQHKKCVVITGCDSGFGNALAKSLYRRGVFVFAGCYTENGAKTLTEETGERLKTFRLDVSKTESIEESFKFVKENLPEGTVLWGVVNNAGIQGYNLPVEFSPTEHIYDVIKVNTFGVIEMVRTFLPLLKKSKGRIVNVISGAGKMAVPYHIPYLTSKFAATGFTESLRREQMIWGVKVSAIFPGFYTTAILNADVIKRRNQEAWDRATPEIREQYGQDYFDTHMSTQLEMNTRGQTDLSPVLDAIEHALFARWPYNAYHPGIETKIFLFLNDFLPSFVFDYMMSLFLKPNIPKALK